MFPKCFASTCFLAWAALPLPSTTFSHSKGKTVAPPRPLARRNYLSLLTGPSTANRSWCKASPARKLTRGGRDGYDANSNKRVAGGCFRDENPSTPDGARPDKPDTNGPHYHSTRDNRDGFCRNNACDRLHA